MEEVKFHDQSKNVFVVGIGGVSRSGKTSALKYLIKKLNTPYYFEIDKYDLTPIKKIVEITAEEIEDWEDPDAHDLDQFYNDIKSQINILNQRKNNDNLIFILVEGFLLYYKKEISDLIDYKILLNVDKEVARDRRKRTHDYPSDRYYDEYLWKGWEDRK